MKCGSGLYPYLEVLLEQVRKKNEIFRSPGRAEVRKAELLIFGSKDRAELRKRSFRPLKVLAEQSWCAEAELHIVGSQGRTEVRKQNFTSYEELTEQKCGTDFMSHHWVRPKGSAGAEFQIFGSPIKLEVWKQNFTSLTDPYPTDCHCQCWRITLLTAIIVIPNEGQCEDQVWLKHRTFAILLTRSLCSRRDSR